MMQVIKDGIILNNYILHDEYCGRYSLWVNDHGQRGDAIGSVRFKEYQKTTIFGKVNYDTEFYYRRGGITKFNYIGNFSI